MTARLDAKATGTPPIPRKIGLCTECDAIGFEHIDLIRAVDEFEQLKQVLTTECSLTR